MLKDQPTAANSGDRALRSTFALIASAVACTIVVLLAPRKVEPFELPALRLDAALVEEQLARDHALAARAPRGADVDRLLALYLEDGLAEAAPRVDFARLVPRRAELSTVARAVFERIGAEGARALAAATVERAIAGLRGELPSREAHGLLGSFPALLARYGFVDSGGVLRAPELSVRTFYKARFNLVCERARDAGFSAIEQQALSGWNALHASRLATEQRVAAARAFYDARGQDSGEALAIWLFQLGSRQHALALLNRGYERTGALRLRNMALFAARAE